MKRKKLILITVGAAVLVLAAVGACVLPFPQRIDLSLRAGEFTREGTEYVGEVPIEIEGHRYRYLLRDDEMELAIRVGSYDSIRVMPTKSTIYDEKNGFQFCSFTYYEGRTNRMYSGYFVFNDDFNAFAVGFNGQRGIFHVASSEADADLQALALEFKAADTWFD